MSTASPDTLDPTFDQAGAAWNVDPRLLKAVASGESTFDPRAISKAGAQGLMQLMPATARGLGVTNAFDPAQSIWGAAKLLSGHLDETNGDVTTALRLYQGGPDRSKWGQSNAAYPAYIMSHYTKVSAPAAGGNGPAPQPAPTPPAGGSTPLLDSLMPPPADAPVPAAPPAPATAAPAPAPNPSPAPTSALQHSAAADPLAAAFEAAGPAPDAAPSGAGADPLAAAFQVADSQTAEAAANPDPSFAQRFGTNLASVGDGMMRGVRDVVDRPAAWLASGADALGLTSGEGNRLTAQNAADRQAYDAAHGDSWMASGGRLTGQIAATAPVLGGAGRLLGAAGDMVAAGANRLMPALGQGVEAVGDFLSGTSSYGGNRLLNMGAQTASRAVNGAIQGSAVGALTSGQLDAPVLDQALAGAGPGAIAGAVLPVAGNAIRTGFNYLTGRAGGAVPEVAQLAQLARDKYNIPVTAPQIADNSMLRIASDQASKLPFSGAGASQEAQQTAFNRAVAGTFGETADRITPAVMSSAAQRIGGVMDGVARRTTINADPQFLTTLARVGGEARQALPTAEQGPIVSQIRNMVEAVQKGNGTISGDTYQALTRADTPLSRAMQSADPNVRFYAGQVRGALEDAFARSASPADQAALAQARGQYRAMKTVEDLVEKSTDGNVAPAQLMGQVRAQSSRFDGSTGGMAYTGGGDLGELAQIGQQFMRSQPNSGTADRLLANGLLLGQGGTIGAVAAGVANPLTLAAGPATLAANRLAGSYLRSNFLANNLVNSSLNPPANRLLGQVFPSAAPIGTAGYNALLGPQQPVPAGR